MYVDDFCCSASSHGANKPGRERHVGMELSGIATIARHVQGGKEDLYIQVTILVQVIPMVGEATAKNSKRY